MGRLRIGRAGGHYLCKCLIPLSVFFAPVPRAIWPFEKLEQEGFGAGQVAVSTPRAGKRGHSGVKVLARRGPGDPARGRGDGVSSGRSADGERAAATRGRPAPQPFGSALLTSPTPSP